MQREEQIVEAARAAYAWEFIERLPDGLDTLVGENGLKTIRWATPAVGDCTGDFTGSANFDS